MNYQVLKDLFFFFFDLKKKFYSTKNSLLVIKADVLLYFVDYQKHFWLLYCFTKYNSVQALK